MFSELRGELARLPAPEELADMLGQWQRNKTGGSRKRRLRLKLLFVPRGLKILLGRPPTRAEIAEACDVSPETIYRALRLSKEVEIGGERKPLASVASGLDVVSSSRLGLRKAVYKTTRTDPKSKDEITNVSKLFVRKGRKTPQGYTWSRAEYLYDTRAPIHPLDGMQLSPSDRHELNGYIASEPFVKVYREVLVGFLEYDLRLARAGFDLPLDKRQALMDFIAPVVQKMIEISERAEKTVKDLKLEELFPWLNPKTPNLDDFFAHAIRTVEEIRALSNQVFIEKFLLPQASVFASN